MKTIKDFTFELLSFLDEWGDMVDIVDFLVKFLDSSELEPSRLKFKMDELAGNGFITCHGHEILSMHGGNDRVDKPRIMAKITNSGEKYLEELKLKKNNTTMPNTSSSDFSKVFIVHGHDNEAKMEVARFIERLGFTSIILHEQASSGKTIIEKIEAYTDVDFGIVIYTACDVGAQKGSESHLNDRGRQNVVFEHGYLIGKLGREKVCALVKGNIETPNDISGVVYIKLDSDEGWKGKVAKEMSVAGYPIEFSKVY